MRDRAYDYCSKGAVLRGRLSLEEYEARKVGSWHGHDDDATQGMMQKKKEGFQVMTHPLGRGKRSVWTIPTHPYPEAHFATYPPELIEPCILAGCPPGGTVLDPFGGSGTTAEVADRLGCHAILIELNPHYIELQRRRTAQPYLLAAMENRHDHGRRDDHTKEAP